MPRPEFLEGGEIAHHPGNVEEGAHVRPPLKPKPPREQESVGHVVLAGHARAGRCDIEAALLADAVHDGDGLDLAVLVASGHVVEFVHGVRAQQVHFGAVALVQVHLNRLQAGDRLPLDEHSIGAGEQVPVLLHEVRQAVPKLLAVGQGAIAFFCTGVL